jgi:hypothetical protein
MRAFPFIVLVLAVLAAVAGWLATPRYRPPADDGEERLAARVVQYYQASRVLDYAAMCQLFTPARQLADTDQLHRGIAEKRAALKAMGPAALKDLQFSADSVTADRIDLEIEGDWAVAGGDCDIAVASGTIPAPLPETVWVRNAGDWWLYTMTVAELNAYGNAPTLPARSSKRVRRCWSSRTARRSRPAVSASRRQLLLVKQLRRVGSYQAVVITSLATIDSRQFARVSRQNIQRAQVRTGAAAITLICVLSSDSCAQRRSYCSLASSSRWRSQNGACGLIEQHPEVVLAASLKLYDVRRVLKLELAQTKLNRSANSLPGWPAIIGTK